MTKQADMNKVDRRLFLGSTFALVATSGAVLVKQSRAQEPLKPTPAGKTLSQILADYVVNFDLKAVPPEVINRARIGFIDTLGVMLAGSREQVAAIAVDMVKAEGSAPAASIVGQSLRTSPQLAALANGVAAHAMDYDFTYISGQAASAIIPAILPVAEVNGATPAECVAAFVIGCEVAGRIVRANFNASSIGGWHTTGMVGVIAAAAAAARLMKLPADKIANALGIGVSMASGLSVNFGTMTKPLHSGHAARDGIMAASLASRGFTSHPSAFEGKAGYFDGFGRGLDVTFEPFKDLGQRYDLVSIGYTLKAYPCGGLTHTSIEAALALREKLGPRVADIKAIHCSVTRNAGQRAGVQYPHSVEAAKFSVSYLVAYSLLHGAPRIPAFTEKAIDDAKVQALAKLVSASVDPALGPGTNGSPALLKVTLADGQVIEQRRDAATGSSEVPMTQAQVEAKFLDCAAQSVSADTGKKILATLNAFPSGSSLNDFWPLLRRA